MSEARKQWGKRLSQATRDRLDSLLKDHKDPESLIIQALDALEASTKPQTVELSESEKELVRKAVQVSGMSEAQLMKIGLLAWSKRSITQAEKHSLQSMSDEKLKLSTVRGAAATRIANAVNHVMQFNDSQEDVKDKVAITESAIFELTGSNRQAIKQWFKDNEQDIQTHMIQHGLAEIEDDVYKVDSTTNRKGKGFDLKQHLGF